MRTSRTVLLQKFALVAFASIVSVVVLTAIAATAANAATLIHSYDFNGSLADTLGSGPDMTNNGATLGPTGLTFGVNQGPTFPVPMDFPLNYSIEMQFTLDTTVNVNRKLIDFDNLTTDSGLYAQNGGLAFFPIANSSGGITAAQPTTILFSASLSFQRIFGYVNDGGGWVEKWDPGNIGAFDQFGLSAVDTVLHFLRDDGFGGTTEATSGFLDYIRIYDGVVTPSGLEAPPAIPLPAAFPLFGTGLGILGFLGWRRRRQAQAV